MSAVTGRSTEAAIRATTPAISARVRFCPSGRPSDQDTPALVVAMARAPAAAIMAALPASQALGKTKIPLPCRALSAVALARWLSVTAILFTLTLRLEPMSLTHRRYAGRRYPAVRIFSRRGRDL